MRQGHAVPLRAPAAAPRPAARRGGLDNRRRRRCPPRAALYGPRPPASRSHPRTKKLRSSQASTVPGSAEAAVRGRSTPARRNGRRCGDGGMAPCLNDAALKAAGPAIPRAPPVAPLGNLIEPCPEPALIVLGVVQLAELFPRHAVEAGRLSLDPAPDLPSPRRPALQGTRTCRSSFPRPRGACAQRPCKCDLRCATAGHLIRQARPAGTPLSRPARPSGSLRPATGRRPNRAGLP